MHWHAISHAAAVAKAEIAPDAVHPQESPVASKIKDSFGGEKGLNGTVRLLPLEKTFELVNIKVVSSLRVDNVTCCLE